MGWKWKASIDVDLHGASLLVKRAVTLKNIQYVLSGTHCAKSFNGITSVDMMSL